ncbi:MAG: GvpL/GvpF family gas vesicle protein [Timaviella obliquedivisa GSE-PSE-MK23-08B]|nr:GvpL/GvpF family gas vesicle protein [Timaviella obliquedivisa GSE-PSE-MK23-08B]
MYTYAFLSTIPSTLPEGIFSSLQIVAIHDLAALVEPDLAADSLQQDDQQLVQSVLSHDRVIRELFEQTTVLPLRFGTCFVSRQGLLEHLQANRAEYLTKLEELEGKAEYVLKLKPIAFPETEIGSTVKGKDYFLAKKQIYQAQAAWQLEQQQELEDLFEAIAQQYRWVRGEPDDGIERIYMLGDRQSEPLLPTSFKTWQLQSAHEDLRLGNPLPPYHFM